MGDVLYIQTDKKPEDLQIHMSGLVISQILQAIIRSIAKVQGASGTDSGVGEIWQICGFGHETDRTDSEKKRNRWKWFMSVNRSLS